jgi:hypothetical protein
MEDFLKKHNFNAKEVKRRNRRFHIVRYYPKIQTYEFINVGIIVYDNDKVFYRFLQSEEISKLHCPSLIESKILRNSLTSLDAYMQNQQKIDSVLEDVSKRYKNILDTSFQMTYSGNEESIPLVDKLFYDYIGYKFDTVEKKTKLSIIINKTEIIVDKEYGKYLKVHESEIRGYSLDFFNNRTKNIHHSLLGSIENSENVARAFLNVPLNISINNKFDFLNTKPNISNNGMENKLRLKKFQLGIYDYTSDEDIGLYCERLLSS